MTITTRAAFVAGALAPRMASAHAELTEDEARRPSRIHVPYAPTNLRVEGAAGRPDIAIRVSWSPGHSHERFGYFWITLATIPLPSHPGLAREQNCISRNRSSRHYPLSGTDHCIRLNVRSGRASYSETVSGLTPETTATILRARGGNPLGQQYRFRIDRHDYDSSNPRYTAGTPKRRPTRRRPNPRRNPAPTSTASSGSRAPPRTLTPGGFSSRPRSRTPRPQSEPTRETTATRLTCLMPRAPHSAARFHWPRPTASSGSNWKAREDGTPSPWSTPRPAPCETPPSPRSYAAPMLAST